MQSILLNRHAARVCFFTLPWIVISGIALIYAIVGVSLPTFTMNSDIYVRYKSNDDYWGCTPHWAKCERKNKDGVTPTEDEVTQQRLKELNREIDKERVTSEQLAVKALLVLIASSILYFLHWRLARQTSSQPNILPDA